MSDALVLKRLRAQELPESFEHGAKTVGLMLVGATPLFTMERPWLPGPAGCGLLRESCIPPGEYHLVMRNSPAHGNRYHTVAPGLGVYLERADRPREDYRSMCMFHIGNHVRNVEGCIAPGRSLVNFGGSDGWGVGNSGDALNLLEEHIRQQNIERLVILSP